MPAAGLRAPRTDWPGLPIRGGFAGGNSLCRVSCNFSVYHVQFLGERFEPVFKGFQVFFIHFRTLSCQLDAVPYFHDDLVLCFGHLVGWYLSGISQLLVGCGHGDQRDVDHLLVAGRDCWDSGWGWLPSRPQANGHAFIKATEISKAEGIFLLRFGNVCYEWPRDVGGDEAVTSREGPMGPVLLLNPFVGGELAQALGDLPVLLDCEDPQVAVPLAQREVVCLSDLFRRCSEGGEGVDVARAGEFPDYAIEVAMVVADDGHLGGVVVNFIIPESHFWVMMDGQDLRFLAIGLVYLL